jgi:hypothetical protein
MAVFSSRAQFASRSGRICCCVWLLGTLAAAPGNADDCSLPEIKGYPGTSTKEDLTFSLKPGGNPGTCDLEVEVESSPNGGPIYITITNPCTHQEQSFKVPGNPNNSVVGSPEVNTAVAGLCGQDWANEYLGPQNTSLRKGGAASPASRLFGSSASTAAMTGAGSQDAVLVDLNGDGNPDLAYIGSRGLVIEWHAADGSVLSSTTYPLPFSTSNLLANTVIAADFNGDGNLDLAVNNLGNPGVDPGGIVILLGNGDGTFGAPAAVSAGLNPLSMAAADFNGDGMIDIAAANQSSGDPSGLGPGTVSVLLGNGDGTFAAPVTYPVGEDSIGFPDSVIALDLNGDGLPDLAVANRNDNSITVLLNAGGGAFQQPSITSLPYGTEFLAYNDFNHDGNLDLLASSQHSNALMMLLGNGDGTFQPPVPYVTGNNPTSIGVVPLSDGTSLITTADSITGSPWIAIASPNGALGAPTLKSVGGFPTGVAVADLSGDGLPDVVVTGAADDVDVLLSQNGQLGPETGYALGAYSPQPIAVAIADLNNDGKPDVITANGAGSVSVLLGNGDGTLGTPISTTVDQFAESLAIADFNGDGNLDVAVASYGPNLSPSDNGSIAVLFGNGDGTFGPVLTLTVNGLHPEAVAAADLNRDGIPDLAAVTVGTSGNPATLAVFLGQPGGTFQPATTFPLQAIGGSQSGIAIGDVNGDGTPDIVAFSDFGQRIDVLLGDGAGGFHKTAQIPKTMVASCGGLTLADVNGDGILDIVTCGSFLLGNGDGTFQTEQQFLSGFNPQAVSITMFGGTPLLVSADHTQTVVATTLVVPATSNANSRVHGSAPR